MQRNLCDSFSKTWTLQPAYTGQVEQVIMITAEP